MKIFNAQQIREWDQYTIQNEPVSSIDLMERAAGQCVNWLEENNLLRHSLKIFCGKGNNGGIKCGPSKSPRRGDFGELFNLIVFI